jgi:hypothetical protein
MQKSTLYNEILTLYPHATLTRHGHNEAITTIEGGEFTLRVCHAEESVFSPHKKIPFPTTLFNLDWDKWFEDKNYYYRPSDSRLLRGWAWTLKAMKLLNLIGVPDVILGDDETGDLYVYYYDGGYKELVVWNGSFL